jgi:hypothetical protein
VYEIDAGERDELGDFDGVRAFGFEGLQLLVGEQHVLAAGVFVALHHVAAFHDLVVVGGADVLLLHPSAALLVQHIEADLLAGGGGEQLHGD